MEKLLNIINSVTTLEDQYLKYNIEFEIGNAWNTIRKESLKLVSQGGLKVIFLDVDGTMTPETGGTRNSLFSTSWESYVDRYSSNPGTRYLKLFLKFLKNNDFVIMFASNNYRGKILNLFNYLGTMPVYGTSRHVPGTKSEFLNTMTLLSANNKYYYIDDDCEDLEKSQNTYNISCNNGWWLGKQLQTIVDCFTNNTKFPENVVVLHTFLVDIDPNYIERFMKM